jgi:membrane fusion protein, multidrug efflux system
MPSVTRRLVPGAFFFAALLFPLLAQTTLAEEKKKAPGPPPMPVRVATVEKQTVADRISLIGSIEAVTRSRVAAEISGLVEAFPARIGTRVRKGAVLARLRVDGLRLQRKAAEAEKERIRANLVLAQKELDRADRLKGSDSIAERSYDETLYRHQALGRQLEGGEANIEFLDHQITQKTVLAPFSGMVAEEHTQVGQWLAPGGAVVTLVDLEKLRVTVDLPERYAALVVPGSPARVMVRSLSETMVPGRVAALLPEGDVKARTIPVHVHVDNPEFRIRVGMAAEISFDLATTRDALLVPKDAVVGSGGKQMVFVVDGGRVRPVPVNTIGYYGGQAAVAGGLEAGQTVVIRGNERLRPGQAVKIIE